MNTVSMIGRLTKDPELHKTESGLSICNLTIAVDDVFSKEDRADFLNVTIFGNQAENCEKYLRKGFLAGIQGRMRSEAYTDSEGIRRYPVKVVADRVQFIQFPEREAAKDAPDRSATR